MIVQAPASPANRSESVPPPVVELSSEQAAKQIRSTVRATSANLRAAHPILAHQDALGLIILGLAALGVLGVATGYVFHVLAWWIAVPAAGAFMAVAHEIEHDLIHRLYFRRNRVVHNAMFAVVWALRPYTISPWGRRPMHLLHHKYSGMEGDVEERSLTNGDRWGLRRLLGLIDPYMAKLVRDIRRPENRADLWVYTKACFPLTFVAIGLWYGFLVAHAAVGVASLLGHQGLLSSGSGSAVLHVVDVLVAIWIGPNVLRGFCLHFVSSNMHYFGDVDEGDVLRQVQVLNRWWLAPLQVFCFNFGSTHAIHHFVPGDPFYIRQMGARAAHRVMRANGVRFNDLDSLRRANRYDRAVAGADRAVAGAEQSLAGADRAVAGAEQSLAGADRAVPGVDWAAKARVARSLTSPGV